MNIKINGNTISIENNTNFNDIKKIGNILSKESEDISKQIKAINMLSNVKAVESFGYKSTEAVGQAIKNGILYVWQKIVNFFSSIINFIKKIIYKMQKLTIFKKIKSSKILSNKSKSLLIDVVSKLGVLLNDSTNQLEKYYVKIANIKKAKNKEELKSILENAKLCKPGQDIDPKLASNFRVALNQYLYILNVNNSFLTYVVNITLSNELFYQKPNIDQLRPKITSIIEDITTNLDKYKEYNAFGPITTNTISEVVEFVKKVKKQFDNISPSISSTIIITLKEIDDYSASHSQIKTEQTNNSSNNNSSQQIQKEQEPPKVIQL